VTSNDNAGQQIQPYLPGMGNKSAIARAAKAAGFKEPHQMSPDEFASHPYAMFSSSHVPAEEFWTKPRFAKTDVLHFGTEQAALDRHRHTAVRPSTPDKPRTTDARMHVFWHVPESEDLPVGEDTAENDFTPGTRYYPNRVEDRGSLSMASNEPDKFKRQADYVREAIASGKGHEVHPVTKAMYDQGVLDKGLYLPLSHTLQYTKPYTGTDSYPMLLQFPDSETTGWSGTGGRPTPTTNPKVSDNGPSLERIKNQVRKDAKRAKRS